VLYLDTSSLLKLLLIEPESRAVDAVILTEDAVLISSLAELETLVQLRAKRLGGTLSRSWFRRIEARLDSLKEMPPFVFRGLPSTVFAIALRQHRDAETHCRSLDRLHLAAMEELEITRLMTHDARQAEAARAMGFDVTTPGLPASET
jgi:predicted nucleic acid-binding protein